MHLVATDIGRHFLNMLQDLFSTPAQDLCEHAHAQSLKPMENILQRIVSITPPSV